MLTLLLAILLAMVIPGVINRTRARLAGRRGVSFYQHISNVELLFRKGAVYSPVTTVIFRAAPVVCLASSLTALMLLPVGWLAPMLSFRGDVVMFCYLLALGRMGLVLAAMDTGSSFEGMGASREALYGALSEPALFATMGTLALVTGQTSFADMFSLSGGIPMKMAIVVILIAYALYKLLIVEAGRVPVDDPKTHLELTMVHEVMALDYTGIDLGMITVSGWLKAAALALLAGNTVGALFSHSVYVVIGMVLALAVVVGFSESFRARNRLVRNTTYILTILAVAMLVFFVALLLIKNIGLE